MVMVECDTATDSTYFEIVANARVEKTRHLRDLLMVDLDSAGEPVGVEVVLGSRVLAHEYWLTLVSAYPGLKCQFPDEAAFSRFANA
ncbi:MAG: hypothetical protein ACRDZ5_00005 [Acidimicrobiales bacterium]